MINILCVGDVCGTSGVEIFGRKLRSTMAKHSADFCIVNGENADQTGIKPPKAMQLFDAGADVITLGNHAFAKTDIFDTLDEDHRILRPENFGPGHPGVGVNVFEINGFRLAVASLIGRVDMSFLCENPFFAADRLIESLKGRADGFVIDFHAEATSEKIAFGRYVAGRVSAVFGTHTHVQTNDACIRSGTGYITDIGMTGADESVIGISVETATEAFLTDGVVRRYKNAYGDGRLCGVLISLDSNGRTTAIKTVKE